MTLVADLEDFVTEHRPHGTLAAATGELTPNGHRLEVACPWGVTFERWITPREASEDLTILPRPSRSPATPPVLVCLAMT